MLLKAGLSLSKSENIPEICPLLCEKTTANLSIQFLHFKREHFSWLLNDWLDVNLKLLEELNKS